MAGKSGFQLSGSGPEAYENVWVPALMGKCAEELVACVRVRDVDRVLDIGCGTGVVAREVARQKGFGNDVVGVDINEAMLESAKRFADQHGISEVEWRRADASSLPFDEAAFDVVLCQQGLQFMPDRPTAMAEMARVLAPSGRLAVSVWRTISPAGFALCDAIDRYFGDGTTAAWHMAFSLGDREELRSLASDAGLKNARVYFDVKITRHTNPEEFVLGVIAGSPMADDVAAMADAERAKLVGEIVAAMDRYIDDDGVANPGECHTLTAQK